MRLFLNFSPQDSNERLNTRDDPNKNKKHNNDDESSRAVPFCLGRVYFCNETCRCCHAKARQNEIQNKHKRREADKSLRFVDEKVCRLYYGLTFRVFWTRKTIRKMRNLFRGVLAVSSFEIIFEDFYSFSRRSWNENKIKKIWWSDLSTNQRTPPDNRVTIVRWPFFPADEKLLQSCSMPWSVAHIMLNDDINCVGGNEAFDDNEAINFVWALRWPPNKNQLVWLKQVSTICLIFRGTSPVIFVSTQLSWDHSARLRDKTFSRISNSKTFCPSNSCNTQHFWVTDTNSLSCAAHFQVTLYTLRYITTSWPPLNWMHFFESDPNDLKLQVVPNSLSLNESFSLTFTRFIFYCSDHS